MADDPTRRTIDTYDAHAAAYAHRNADPGMVRGLVDAFARHLPAGRVLDAGCGHGRDCATLAGRGFRVTGADLSRGQLVQAVHHAPGAGLVQADLRRLPCRAGAFDGVWACASLLHLRKSDLPGALRELRRVLRRDGVLLVSVKHGEGEHWLDSPYGDGQRFFAFYQPQELATLLAGAGFHAATVLDTPGWVSRVALAE